MILYEISQEVIAGRRDYRMPDAYIEEWLAQDPAKNITFAIAVTAAHEVGHTLGLDHRSGGLHFLSKKSNEEMAIPSSKRT